MWVQNLYSGLPVGETEQVSLGDIPAGSHLPRKGTWEVEENKPPLQAPAAETAHLRSGSRRLTQPQIQSPRESTSAKSHGDSFRRRVRGPQREGHCSIPTREVLCRAARTAARLGRCSDEEGAERCTGPRGTAPPAPRGQESAGCPSARHQPTLLSVISAELK